MTPPHFFCVLLLTLFACSPVDNAPEFNKETIISEVTQMFDNYHRDIREQGLTGEFKYLDQSDDFFWVPPGYESALTFDSVKAILVTNAAGFEKVEFHFDTLQIFPLATHIASYSGIVKGSMKDITGNQHLVAIIESGTVIKRPDGWKLLCGQSANLPAN